MSEFPAFSGYRIDDYINNVGTPPTPSAQGLNFGQSYKPTGSGLPALNQSGNVLKINSSYLPDINTSHIDTSQLNILNGWNNAVPGANKKPFSILDSLNDKPPPTTTDSWLDPKGKGGFLLGMGQLGLGGFQLGLGLKNLEIMKDYYGTQKAIQLADFGNNAQMTNLKLDERVLNALGNQNINPNSTEGQKQIADMQKWKVKTSIG